MSIIKAYIIEERKRKKKLILDLYMKFEMSRQWIERKIMKGACLCVKIC